MLFLPLGTTALSSIPRTTASLRRLLETTYFNDSDGDCDESGSEDDVECGKIVLTSPERSLHSLKFQTWYCIIAFRKILNQVLKLMLLQMLTHPCFAETSTINDAGDERYHEGKQL